MRTTGLLMLLTMLGCAKGDGPVEPIWGKEQCAHCMMLVSERAPAAQALLEGGQRKFFDDVGCMVLWGDQEKVTPRAWWVRVGDGWVKAEEARYARGRTPMDFGFLGATEGVGFEEVKAEVRSKGSAHGAMR